MTAVRKRDDPLNSTAGQLHLCYNSLAAHSLPANCKGQLESQRVANTPRTRESRITIAVYTVLLQLVLQTFVPLQTGLEGAP